MTDHTRDAAIVRFNFEHAGRTFTGWVFADDVDSPPWEREDGHGPVRTALQGHLGTTMAGKRPGERPLGEYHLYDWAAAMKQAKADGWGLGESALARLTERKGRLPTRGELAAAAVQEDFDRLRGYLDDRWSYVGVGVTLEGDSDASPYAHACWGIESDSDDFIRELAEEQAGELARELTQAEQDVRIARYAKARHKFSAEGAQFYPPVTMPWEAAP